MSESRLPGEEVFREFGDRSTLWLLEDPVNLRDLLRLIDPEVVENLDFTRAQRVNRSFILADLQKQESDVIFRVPVRMGGGGPAEVWVYVLLEHQSSPDREMPLRLLLYMTQLWSIQLREWRDRNIPAADRRLTPVVPVVLYTGRDGWPVPLRLADLCLAPAELSRFIPHWETLMLDVRGTEPELLTQIGTAVGWALRILQAEQEPLAKLREVLSEALQGLEGLSEEQSGQWIRVAQYFLLLIFHRRERSEYTVLQEMFWEQVRQSKFREDEEVVRMAQTMAEYVREQAGAEGEARGEVRGEARGLKLALITNLEEQFGSLPLRTRQTIDRAEPDQVLLWIRLAAKARSLSDLGIPEGPEA